MAQVFKQRLIPLVILGTVIILIAITGIVSAQNSSVPTITETTPSEGGVIQNNSATVSFTVYDPDFLSDSSGSYYIKINGSIVPASFQYKGYTDSCSGEVIIEGYDEATITGTVSGLVNGTQSVEVMATDRLGNAVVKTWSFSVAVKPAFSQMNPAPNSVTTNNTSVSAKITSNSSIDANSVVFKVDGVIVTSAFNASTGIVSYTANPPLAAGLHNVVISLTDSTGNNASTSWSYTYSNGPSMTFAGSGSTYTTASTNLSISVSSGVKLANFASAALDGKSVNASFTYPGHWVSSGCSSTYVIDSYYQGTIAIQTANLKDGEHTISVTAKDQNNNTTTLQWTFKVNCKPVISAPSPGNGIATTDTTGFTVKVTDNDPIDQSAIAAKLDGVQVPATFDVSTGLVSYKPALGLNSGSHTVNLSVADVTGNTSIFTWSFTIQNSGPQITFNNEGSTFITSTPGLSFAVSSTVKLDNNVTVTLDGQPVTATFTYPGHWVSSYCSSTYVIDDYTKGTVTYQAGNLKDGNHTVILNARDTLGNTTSRAGSFKVNSSPGFSGASPGANSTVNTNSGFSVRVSDNDSINAASIVVKLDNTIINSNFDSVTGTISYQNPSGIPDGAHTVNVSASDTTGNVSTYSWSFTVKTAGPGLTFTDAGTTYNSYKTTVTANVYSSIKLSDTGFKMLIDNAPVDATFTYKGHFESGYCSSTWVVDDYTTGTITAFPELNDGSHVLSVTAKDSSGNEATKTWSFSVKQPPLITNSSPTGTIATNKPSITATISDPNGPAIDKSSIRLIVDNNVVNATLTDVDGSVKVSFIPNALVNDTSHTVSVTAKDTSGNTASTSWSFYVATKADMPVTAKDCGACHALNDNNKWVHTMSPDAGMTGSGGTCGHCHKSAAPEFCGYCHNGDPWAQVYGAAPDPPFDANMNCSYCHGLDDNGMVQRKVIVSVPPSRQLSSWYKISHNIPQAHTINKEGCNSCHSVYLTREHNRVTKNGVQITCLTCHQSSNPKVQQAILARNMDCKACHDNYDHDLLHTGYLENDCQTCHTSILTQEHLKNTITQKKTYDCSTCHEKDSVDDQRTIAAGKLNCAGCHVESHKINFADVVPQDILPDPPGTLLEKKFEWSEPLEASIFDGDSGTPSGYENGQVVISKRRTDITAEQIWNYFNQILLAGRWTLKSAVPILTNHHFTAEFTKGSRSVTIVCYNTDSSAGGETTGYRIELWYK